MGIRLISLFLSLGVGEGVNVRKAQKRREGPERGERWGGGNEMRDGKGEERRGDVAS